MITNIKMVPIAQLAEEYTFSSVPGYLKPEVLKKAIIIRLLEKPPTHNQHSFLVDAIVKQTIGIALTSENI